MSSFWDLWLLNQKGILCKLLCKIEGSPGTQKKKKRIEKEGTPLIYWLSH